MRNYPDAARKPTFPQDAGSLHSAGRTVCVERMDRSLARTLPAAALLIFSSLVASLAPSYADTVPPGAIALPMTQDSWSEAPPEAWAGKTSASIKFARYEGMPSGTMTVNEAVAVSKDARFSSGTIEFDMKPLAYSDTGIIFRRQGNDFGEFVYARANPDCPAADDCIQYAPIVHGRMDWDIYVHFEGQAPIAPTGWNHFRLVVAGDKMLVYVNRQTEPSLVVPRLQGLSTDGGIAFKGPALYANLVLRPGAPEALPGLHEPPPDPGTITAWLTAAPDAFPVDRPVPAADIPPANVWRKLQAEPSGLVNLSRAFGSPKAPMPAIGWLKTVIEAASPLQRTLRIGWAREVTVFLNGKPIFSGDNTYYPEAHRLSPNGRLEPDNASIPLALRQGKNEIVMAVGDRWTTGQGIEKLSPYGWGAEAHLDDLTGITLVQ
jgi:hypothetical protein